MAGKYLMLSATGVVLGLTGSICICLSFFTKSWLNVIVDQSGMENDPLADINQQEAAESPDAGFYGLWDYGPSDFKKSFLNCEAIPFAVCMYTRNRFIPTYSKNEIFDRKSHFVNVFLFYNEIESIKRAGLFSAVILIVPAMLLALLSAAVLASHGQIHTTACLGSTAGMMAFTLQQTICISTCPPDYPYFPQVKVGTASLAWSFYIGWVGSGLLLMAASALLALSCEAASQVRESKFAMTRALNNPLSRPNITASQALSQHSGKV